MGQSTKLGSSRTSEVGVVQAALLRATQWQIDKPMREETSVRYNIPFPRCLFLLDTGETEDLHSAKSEEATSHR